MHKNILALIFIVAMLISPAQVFAFGLGEIEINSALNQPMDAEIELVGFKAAQIDEVQVELASQEMFERVGVPRPYILTRLKFTPTISGGKPVIRVTSTDSVREPFLTFLIDVRWAKGKLLREYTVLLDPPVFGDKARATIEAPSVATQAAPTAKKSAPKSIAKTPAPRVPTPSVRPTQAAVPSTDTKPVPLKKTKSQPGTRRVNRGDTLWSVAEPYARENGVSINQMMLAIQSANPQSFSGNNINNLKSGVVLRIPTDNLYQYSAKEALAEVQRQWQVWKQGAQPSAAVNVDAGDIDSKAMPAATASSEDAKDASSKLSILGEGEASDGKSGEDAQATLNDLRKQVSLLKENSESKGQENSELKDRIESLESMIKKQEDIISLQNEQLAQLQNSLTATGTDEEQTNAVNELMEEANETVAEAQEVVADAGEEMADKAEQVIKPATVEPLPDFSGPIPEEFLTSVEDETSQPSAAESLVAEAEVPADEPVVEQPADSAAQMSLVDKLLAMAQEQGKTLLYAGGGILALLLAWLGIKRRRENAEAKEVEASGLPVFADEPTIDENLDDTVVATPDSVDEALDDLEAVSDAEELPQTEEVAQTDDADSDDVLAEADVYVSYGLYQQAEELLKEGLAKDPNNAKYQFKLAEIYHADKKSDEFVQHVESIESSFDKNSAEWSKLAVMGAALAPAHALFSGDSAAAVESVAEEVTGSSTEVIDAAADAAEESIDDFEQDIEDFDSDDLSDDNSLDFAFDDDNDSALSDLDDAPSEALESDNELDVDELEESSTAILEAGLDFDEAEDATQAFNMDADANDQADADSSDDATEVFLNFDEGEIEKELNADVAHDSETEMLDESLSSSIDLDDAINLDEADANGADTVGIKIDNDLDEMLESDGDASETAMFDSSLFDPDSPEAKAFANDGGRVDEDTVSLEQVQENLTAELETLSFDGDIDPENIEEDSLPTLQTSEIGKPDLDVENLEEDLAASETGTFEKEMLSDDVTEQFDVGDVGDIDATMSDLGEFGDDYELENPSVIEEVGTKLDLAKAFVDMGDEDAAKETLTEVMEQGDQTQIQEAKDLLDKLS